MGHPIIISALLVASLTPVAPPTSDPLQGNWRQDGGSATFSIIPCSGSTTLCAMLTAKRLPPDELGNLNQVVVRNIRPSGQSQWTGELMTNSQPMKANIRLVTPSRATFKVCGVAFMCKTISFNRI
jgi:uncharacterized protein (DUF2147 family)